MGNGDEEVNGIPVLSVGCRPMGLLLLMLLDEQFALEDSTRILSNKQNLE
jgi:hypothetical protein